MWHLCHNAMLEWSPSEAWSGTCGVGALEAGLAVVLRGGAAVDADFYDW